MIKKITLCLLIVTTFGLALKAQKVPKLRIDPAQAYGGVVSDYFQEVNYIPLQTTKQSLFGTISSMVITDSSFVVSDNDTHAVLFFKKDGTYITKVKFKNDDYPNVSYEASTKRILISVYSSQTRKADIQYYSATGLKLDVKIKIESNERNQVMVSLGDDYYLNIQGCYIEPGKKPVDSVAYAISIYKNKTLYKSFLPFNEAHTPCLCALGFWPAITKSDQDSVVYASTPFDNAIYRVTKDTLQKIYTVVFPFDRMLPKSLLETTDTKRIDSLRDNLYKMQNIISGVSNIYFENNLMLFKIDPQAYMWTQGTEESKQYNLVYNLKTSRLVSLERITPDEKSSFLPLIAGFYMSVNGLVYNDGYFYSSVPSLQMFSAKENTKDKNPKYPPVLENYFKTESRKSNPVIVQMKLRKL
ncbi:MAG TPA: 6-bladed beta-propeller [Hanamia sp.]